MSDKTLGTVRTEISGHVFHIHIGRPEKRNAFTPQMFADMEAAYAELDRNDDLWVGLVTFEGDHTTAGLDLPLFFGNMQSGDGERDPDRLDVFALNRRCRKPIVMAVQGITFTIGLEMMLAADIAVAADDCRFCQMEPKRGLGVFAGGNIRQVQRAGWGNAMYHLLRADEFGADRALQLGYVQEVHPPGTHIDRARAIADEIAANAPIAIQYIKRASLEYIQHGEQAAIDIIPEMRVATSSSEDAKEGMASFMERRAPRFTGR
jgi:enoyl-CoA hydratase/carnithine racemase